MSCVTPCFPEADHCRRPAPVCRPPRSRPVPFSREQEPASPEGRHHGHTDVLFEPPRVPACDDQRPLRERCLNKRAMERRQTGGVVGIPGGQLQFGRHREGDRCPGQVAPDRGSMEWSNKEAQTSLPSTGDSRDLFPDDGVVPLAAPEFNTTLRLAGRLRDLEAHQPDMERVLEEHLRSCSCAAQHVRHESLRRLNYCYEEHQYGNLVPVEVNESILIRQIEAEKQAVVEACKPTFGRRSRAPDVHDLMHLAVQHEFPVPPDPALLRGPRLPPPEPLGYDDLAESASRRHQQLFGARQPL